MKKNRVLRVLPLLLAVVLLLPLVSLLTASRVDADSFSNDSKVQDYEAQIKELEAQIAAQKKKIAEAMNNMADASQNVKYLEEMQTIVESKITISEQLLEELDSQIRQLDEEITQQEAGLAETFEHFRERMRASYEEGDATYLGLLLGADSLKDFLSKWDYVSALLNYDRNLMEAYRASKASLEEKKAVQELSLQKQTELLSTLEEQKTELDTMKANATLYLNQIKATVSAQQDNYGQMQENLEDANKQLEAYLEELAKQSASEYSGEGMIWPLPGFPYISSNYGWRTYTYNGKKITDFHLGIDISGGGVYGANIVAVASGTVITATAHSSYGNYVILDHGGGIYTLYAHSSKLLVSKGDKVEQGQTIALVGSTGQSTGAHLHFEVRVNGKTVDPIAGGYVIQPKK